MLNLELNSAVTDGCIKSYIKARLILISKSGSWLVSCHFNDYFKYYLDNLTTP